MMWKSEILPSTERYIVMGDMATRLRRVTSFRVKGEKRVGMGGVGFLGGGLWSLARRSLAREVRGEKGLWGRSIVGS